MLHRPIETARITGHVLLGQFHLSGLRVYQDLRITSGLPVIRPERTLCKADYNFDRVSGLNPSVHKPDLSVWTGSVFE